MAIKLTESRLRQIIREEVKKSVLREDRQSDATAQAAKQLDNERWHLEDHNMAKCESHIVIDALRKIGSAAAKSAADEIESQGGGGRLGDHNWVQIAYAGFNMGPENPALDIHLPWRDKRKVGKISFTDLYEHLDQRHQQRIDVIVKDYISKLKALADKLISTNRV